MVARVHRVPFAERDVFLDNDATAPAVQARLAETEMIARRTGAAVAIGHPHEGTLDALETWLESVEQRGFAVVPITAIVARREARNAVQAKVETMDQAAPLTLPPLAGAVSRPSEISQDAHPVSDTYRVSGMTCGGCVRAVTNAIKAAVPSARVDVDLAAGKVTVDGAGADVVYIAPSRTPASGSRARLKSSPSVASPALV